MNIIIAPDSFKGTLSALEVCDIIEKAFTDVMPDCAVKKLPLADGGEGLCACLESICPGRMIQAEVTGVFGEKLTAEYLLTQSGAAVIETASCAGLPLALGRENPETATTKGVGELMLHALENGAKEIILGLGGSATNDFGIGAASALGWKFYAANGLIENPAGKDLGNIVSIKAPSQPFPLPVTAACDVENPLYGENGAAFVFAPQKGADKEMVLRLDRGLRNIAEVVKKDLGRDVSSMKGAGAAGGFGGGASVFFGAELKKGINLILDLSGFDSLMQKAGLVITGEGRLDSQSLQGKVISGVTERAVKAGRKVALICGSKGKGYEKVFDAGVSNAYFCCEEPKPFDEILKTCRQDLYSAARRAALDFKT